MAPAGGGSLARLNRAIANSFVGKYFQLSERETTFTAELRAGTATFLTTAYILVTNASIMRDSGGPCTVNDCEFNTGQLGCQFGDAGRGFDPGYLACLERARRQFISATAITSFIACFLMGVVANMPLAVAPGMGVNAFFVYTVVGFFGTGGLLTYKQAVAAVFVEGWLFVIISVTGVRGHLIRLIPKAVMSATAGGIGLFLTFIGLQSSNGLGLITLDPATLVTLGGCPLEEQVHAYLISNDQVSSVCQCQLYNGTAIIAPGSPNLGPPSANHYCSGKRMRSATAWLGISGGLLMVILMGRDFRGAVITGILFVTFVSWIPDTAATYLGASSQIPGGEERYAYFKQVVSLPNVDQILLAWDWSAFGSADLWAAMISFLYLNFLDCTGTLFSMAVYINRMLPGFIDPNTKEFPNQTMAFCVDGVAIILAGILGISPLTCFIESAAGIREGGRTGLTAITVAGFFFLALFFTPIIASIPPYASGPALLLVGALMMENLLDISWEDVQQAVPAFLTIALIPLSYSIAYGVIAGLGSSLALWVLFQGYDLSLSILGISKQPCKQVFFDSLPELLRPATKSRSGRYYH